MNNDIPVIWCPFCHTRATVKRFLNDRYPQCSKTVDQSAILLRDPYSSRTTNDRKPKRAEKDFQFDQKGGTNAESRSSGASRVEETGELFGVKGRV